MEATNPMTTALALKGADFDEKVLRAGRPVLIDFWAPWCGPCKQIAPHVEAIAQEFAGKVDVYKVDVDEESDLTLRFGILSIPTLLIFKNGELVSQMVGGRSKDEIRQALERVLA
ncbi:MAG: thioredoxin [Armatimonadetes bacterium]|nr:MAG: thioredoxin [Armatimonadota bacterium]MCE7898883.1 thioredoxin [Armatimonadetes bacterium ATM1]MDL1929527.1 thioredoxin [Fimbriimonadia bacterium ATM]MBC6969614.1 thioredoxin [Armatimonadota bacterium]MBL1149052.1 thioredoxin [Armatimonadota bacterium]